MRHAGRISGFALLLLLGGCGSGAESPRGTKSIKAANPYVERLRSLSEMNRGLALRRAVQDSGQACKRAESVGTQPDYKNMSVWTLRCANGKDWMLFIAPNGAVQVRACADLATLGLPRCRFDPA